MKTPRITFILGLALAAVVPTYADQNLAGNVTITGGATGNLFVTGYIDSDNNQFTFGTESTGYGVRLLYASNSVPAGATDTLSFLANRNPASWLWLKNTGTIAAPVYANVMRLDGNNQLLLFQSNGTTAGVTLTPASNQLALGTATLTASGTALSTNGALTVASGITNTNGTLTGGATGLTLNAGGTNQNITLTPSGSGNLVLIPPPGTGNVGIKTATPDKSLHVSFDSPTVPALKIGSGTDAQGWYTFLGNDTASATTSYIGNAYNNDAAAFQIRMKGTAAASARLTVLGNGNVGIGTSTPVAKLQVAGDASDFSLKAALSLSDIGAGGRGYSMSSRSGYFMIADETSAAVRVTLNSSGNVGIGTGSPSTRLHALGGSNYTGTIVADGPSSGYSSFGLYENGTYKASMYWHPGAAGVSFYGPSKWFFESGSVGIGTNSPGSRKLNVQSLDSTNDVGVEIGLGRTTGTNYGLIVSTTGLGAGLNQGIFTTARDGTSNYGLRIYNVLAAPSNYALFSDSPAQSYFQGNVGIGTTSPGALLHVKAPVGPLAVRFEGQTNAYASKLYLSSVSSGDGGLQYDANDNTMSMFSYGDVKFHVGTGNISGAIANERMRITQSGYVGIGTSSPGAPLEIKKPNGGGRWQFVDEGADVYSAINIRNSANTAFLPHTFRSAGFTVNDGTADRLTVAVGGNVGVGTASPQARLQLGSLSDGTGEATNHGDLLFAKQNTTLAATGGIEWKIAPDNYGAKIDTIAAGGANLVFGLRNGATTWTESMRISPLGNVGIGTTAPTHKLSVNGTIRAKEIIVDTGWADYVFDANYRLAPLSEIEQHIKAEKHLPGIPSAAEIAEHGVSMGDMQSKLLSKIEELTLHMIAQEKRIEKLEQENQQLKTAAQP